MNGHEAATLARAGEQYGVITRAQARAAGMTGEQIDHRLETGRFTRLHRGVFRIAGAPITRRQAAIAACLWLGEHATVSHLAAGALLRFDGIRRPPLHLTVPVDVRRGTKGTPFILHRVQHLDRIDRVVVDGIPCTSATRTLIDIATLVDDEQLEIAFESARRMGLTSVDHLATRHTALGRRPGAPAVRRLLEHQHDGVRPLESPLEVKLWRLVRASALPRPERQVPIGDYRVDMLWPNERLVLECDGFEAHAGYLRWKRDRRRVAALEALGYRVLHVTWDDVTKRPAQVIARLTIALSLAA